MKNTPAVHIANNWCQAFRTIYRVLEPDRITRDRSGNSAIIFWKVVCIGFTRNTSSPNWDSNYPVILHPTWLIIVGQIAPRFNHNICFRDNCGATCIKRHTNTQRDPTTSMIWTRTHHPSQEHARIHGATPIGPPKRGHVCRLVNSSLTFAMPPKTLSR